MVRAFSIVGILTIAGGYLVLGNGATIRDVEEGMVKRPRGTYLVVAGDLSVDMDRTGGQVRDEDIANIIL